MVPHPPQTLIPSSGSTTPLRQISPPAESAWCLTPRKPFFLRPEAPRPQLNWRRRRGRRGASPPPANSYFFVRRHHALNPNDSAGGVGMVPHPPQTLITSSGSTTPSTQMTPPARAEPLQLHLPRSGRSPYSFLRPQGPDRSPQRVFRRRSRHNSWK